ncbi:MAG: class II glutamine amidotransferase [Pseudomonadota bacterium]
MCRWLAYSGEAIFLEELISAPTQSLIAQSRHALEAKTDFNADGFGIGWYGERPEPGRFRDVLPAWSDENLTGLIRQLRARLFLAHVRASTGAATSRQNCHPFAHGRWLFVHNGQIGEYQSLRRALESRLPDELYQAREGTTDSELIFLTMLAEGLEDRPLEAAEAATGQILARMTKLKGSFALRLTLAFTDGDTLYALRYASDAYAPSLYWRRTGPGGLCLASEPLDDTESGWQAVPTNTFLTVRDGQAVTRPFQPALAADRALAS